MVRTPCFDAERDRLENALGLLAALVAEDTAFLPFFIRIEADLDRLTASTSAVERAKALAGRQRATR